MTCTSTVQRSLTLDLIDRMIALTERDIQSLSEEEDTGGPLSPQTRQAAGGAPVLKQTQLEELDLVLDHLRQIKDWLTKDVRLLPLVDEYIGQRVSAMEQRQLWQNVVLGAATTIVGVVLGWLASLLGTPQTVLHLAGH